MCSRNPVKTAVRNMVSDKAPCHGFLIILFLIIQGSLVSDTQNVCGCRLLGKHNWSLGIYSIMVCIDLPFLTMTGKAFVVLDCCYLRAQISHSLTGFCFHLFIKRKNNVQNEKIIHGCWSNY